MSVSSTHEVSKDISGNLDIITGPLGNVRSVSLVLCLWIQWTLSIGAAEAQSVEHATPGEEVLGSIVAVAARSLLVGYNVTG